MSYMCYTCTGICELLKLQRRVLCIKKWIKADRLPRSFNHTSGQGLYCTRIILSLLSNLCFTLLLQQVAPLGRDHHHEREGAKYGYTNTNAADQTSQTFLLPVQPFSFKLFNGYFSKFDSSCLSSFLIHAAAWKTL